MHRMSSRTFTLKGMRPEIRLKETFAGNRVNIQCVSDNLQFFLICENTLQERMAMRVQMVSYVLHNRIRNGLMTRYAWTLDNYGTGPVEVLPAGIGQ